MPTGMHNVEVRPLKRQRQRGQKCANLLSCRAIGQDLRHQTAVFGKLFAAEPVVVVLLMPEEQMKVVVSQHTLRESRLDDLLNPPHDAGAIRTAIGQIAEEHESSFGMLARRVVSQMPEE